jgi:hypothetical protein
MCNEQQCYVMQWTEVVLMDNGVGTCVVYNDVGMCNNVGTCVVYNGDNHNKQWYKPWYMYGMCNDVLCKVLVL